MLEPNLDIATAGQSEYFSVFVPAGTTGTMQVQVQSQGLSLLAPKVTVSLAGLLGNTVVGSANGLGQYGTTLNVTVPNVSAGQLYYVQVQGADNSAFGTGDYALGLSFNGTTPPVEPSPIFSYLDGSPLQSGGGEAQQTGQGYNITGAPPTIMGISPDTSGGAGVTSANRITISGLAPAGETITLYNNGTPIGTTVSNSSGNWTFDNTGTALPDGNDAFTATATDPVGNVSGLSQTYGVTIESAPPPAPSISGVAPGIPISGGWAISYGTSPILYGTAVPFSQVAIYDCGWSVGTTTADRSGHWDFSASSSVPPGCYTLTATATDLAGVTSSQSVPFSVAVLSPTSWAAAVAVTGDSVAAYSALGTSPDGYIETTNTPTINGTATANSQVVVFEDGIVVGVASVNCSGNWSFACSTLTSGVHKLTFEDTNQSGNFSAPTGR